MSLSSTGLAYKAAWQAERKSLWQLLSSWMASSSRSHMTLPCCLWSNLAWEALQASAFLMATAQMVLASRCHRLRQPWLLGQFGCR